MDECWQEVVVEIPIHHHQAHVSWLRNASHWSAVNHLNVCQLVRITHVHR